MSAKQPSSLKLSPPVHRGLAELDRSLFTLNVPVVGARMPAQHTGQFTKGAGKKHVLWIPRIAPIVHDPEDPARRVVLLKGQDKSSPELLQTLKDQGYDLVDHTLSLPYDYWTADQILQAILPEDLLDESPTSFTQVGHIAHLNLRDEYLPYRHLIGQVILDKNKTIRTVVNKLDTIDNEYRNFKMEVLAGDDEFVVTTAEEGCTFKFDFSKVYWNSRLQTEHSRLVDSFSEHDLVCDACAGVGPFAVPAAKKGCAVLASDLNPASASALEENVRINRVQNIVRTGNADAREYIKQSVLDAWRNPFPAFSKPLTAREQKRLQRQQNEARRAAAEGTPAGDEGAASDSPSAGQTEAAVTFQPRRLIDHFVMNLPAMAIEFLGAFKGLYVPLFEQFPEARAAIEGKGVDRLPMVHCYCFTKDVEHAEKDICERATRYLGLPVTPHTPGFNLRFVRDVAPKKEMYCLEFRLTREMVEWSES